MKNNTTSTYEMYKLYQDGLSLEKVGKIFNITRQSVYQDGTELDITNGCVDSCSPFN